MKNELENITNIKFTFSSLPLSSLYSEERSPFFFFWCLGSNRGFFFFVIAFIPACVNSRRIVSLLTLMPVMFFSSFFTWMALSAFPEQTSWTNFLLSRVVSLAGHPPRLFWTLYLDSLLTRDTVDWLTLNWAAIFRVVRPESINEMMLSLDWEDIFFIAIFESVWAKSYWICV